MGSASDRGRRGGSDDGFRPGWAYRDGKLYRFERSGVTVLRAWPEPLAWRKARGGGWCHVRPRLELGRLVAHARQPFREYAQAAALMRGARPEDIEGPAAALPLDAPTLRRVRRAWRARRETVGAFLEAIPLRARRAIRGYSSRQWHLLSFLARCPGGFDLVRSNPALAYALASNWVFHEPRVRQPMRAARSLVRRPQRDIAAWLGFPPSRSAVRLLRRLPKGSVGIASLCRLRRAVRDPARLRVLRHARRITSTQLATLARDDCWRVLTPRLAQRLGEPGGPALARMLADTMDMARQVGEPVRVLHSVRALTASHDALARHQREYGFRALDAYEIPPPPIPGAQGIEPLTTPDDYREEGRAMNNCVLSYVPRAAGFRLCVYRVLRPERATLAVGFRDERWRILELLGPSNRRVRMETRHAVEAWLHAADRAHVPWEESPWRSPRVAAGRAADLHFDDIPF